MNFLRRPLLLATYLLVTACAHTILDRDDTFLISVEVLNDELEPLDDVSCFFLDVDLDQWRSKTSWEKSLGETNQSGQLREAFSYSWGYRVRGKDPSRLPKGKKLQFAIRLSKPGYQPVQIDFLLDQQHRDEKEVVQVNLGSVRLFREGVRTLPALSPKV